jgi:hypothetical protein
MSRGFYAECMGFLPVPPDTTRPPERSCALTAGNRVPALASQHPEAIDSAPSPELLIVRAAIKRLSLPRSDREKVRAGIIRLLTDPTVLDDDDREVA